MLISGLHKYTHTDVYLHVRVHMLIQIGIYTTHSHIWISQYIAGQDTSPIFLKFFEKLWISKAIKNFMDFKLILNRIAYKNIFNIKF